MGLYTKNSNPHNGKIVKQTTTFMEAFTRYQRMIPRNTFKILSDSCKVDDLVWSWISGEWKWDNGRRGSASVNGHHVVVTVFGKAELGGVFGGHLIVKVDDKVVLDLEPFSQFRSYTSDRIAKWIKQVIDVLDLNKALRSNVDDWILTYPAECRCDFKGKSRYIFSHAEILDWISKHMPED